MGNSILELYIVSISPTAVLSAASARGLFYSLQQSSLDILEKTAMGDALESKKLLMIKLTLASE